MEGVLVHEARKVAHRREIALEILEAHRSVLVRAGIVLAEAVPPAILGLQPVVEVGQVVQSLRVGPLARVDRLGSELDRPQEELAHHRPDLVPGQAQPEQGLGGERLESHRRSGHVDAQDEPVLRSVAGQERAQVARVLGRDRSGRDGELEALVDLVDGVGEARRSHLRVAQIAVAKARHPVELDHFGGRRIRGHPRRWRHPIVDGRVGQLVRRQPGLRIGQRRGGRKLALVRAFREQPRLSARHLSEAGAVATRRLGQQLEGDAVDLAILVVRQRLVKAADADDVVAVDFPDLVGVAVGVGHDAPRVKVAELPKIHVPSCCHEYQSMIAR